MSSTKKKKIPIFIFASDTFKEKIIDTMKAYLIYIGYI